MLSGSYLIQKQKSLTRANLPSCCRSQPISSALLNKCYRHFKVVSLLHLQHGIQSSLDRYRSGNIASYYHFAVCSICMEWGRRVFNAIWNGIPISNYRIIFIWVWDKDLARTACKMTWMTYQSSTCKWAEPRFNTVIALQELCLSLLHVIGMHFQAC